MGAAPALISYRRDCQPGAMQLLDDDAGVEGDQVGRLLSAIDDTRHLACPPSRSRCPLTCLRAYLGLDCNNVGHVRS